MDSGPLVFAKDTSDELFSLCCGSEPRDFLCLTWIELSDEDKALLASGGFKVVSSFTAHCAQADKYLCTEKIGLASALKILNGEAMDKSENTMSKSWACCGHLVLKSTSDESVVKTVPICFGVDCSTDWYYTESNEVVYVISNRRNAYVSVSMTQTADLPLYAAFVREVSERTIPSYEADQDVVDLRTELVLQMDSLRGILTDGLNNLADRMSKLPDMDQTHKTLDTFFNTQGKKLASLATSDQLGRLTDTITEAKSEVKEQISGLESRSISPTEIHSIGDLLNTVLSSLSKLRSYDDELKDLVSTMSSSLITTYSDVLAKAQDVALKDVSLANSVSSLSEALEKLGSLRSLAEKSDSALDSLVTLLPTLSNIESHIVSGAQRLSDDCAKLSEASGKVEACAEQALSSTVSSNNTLSAIKDCSKKRDIALVTMTALTAAASVASSVASIKQSKRGPRC